MIDDLAAMSKKEADTFATLSDEIKNMVDGNRTISGVTVASEDSVQQARQTVERFGSGVSSVAGSLNHVANAAGDITRIALHTKIVAFNASVEAKRAGTAGEGFSVVADAVRELADRVEKSSAVITKTVAQLEANIKQLAMEIQSREESQKDSGKKLSFHSALSKVERGVGNIAADAQKNLDGCDGLIRLMSGLTEQVKSTARALQDADKETDHFLTLSEELIELVADGGVRTTDSPFIESALELAARIGRLFEAGIGRGVLTAADMFDREYRPVAGTDPEQSVTRYTEFTDRVLPEILETAMGWSPKIAFCVVTDPNGYVPNNVRIFSKPPGPDPVWNQANCRYRRIFNGRTEMAAIRSKRKFLLQTYRRDMGGGSFVVMKHLSAPIFVQGQKWGALRIGYAF